MPPKPIRLCAHLRERLRLREIDAHVPEQILRAPERLFLDTETGYRIGLAPVQYRGAQRVMMVAFEETEDEIVAVTIHPLGAGDIEAKLKSGRWVP